MERLTRNEKVRSSILRGGSTFPRKRWPLAYDLIRCHRMKITYTITDTSRGLLSGCEETTPIRQRVPVSAGRWALVRRDPGGLVRHRIQACHHRLSIDRGRMQTPADRQAARTRQVGH